MRKDHSSSTTMGSTKDKKQCYLMKSIKTVCVTKLQFFVKTKQNKYNRSAIICRVMATHRITYLIFLIISLLDWNISANYTSGRLACASYVSEYSWIIKGLLKSFLAVILHLFKIYCRTISSTAQSQKGSCRPFDDSFMVYSERVLCT